MAAYVISAKAAGEQVTDYLRQELHATQREINECNEQMNVCGDDITSSNTSPSPSLVSVGKEEIDDLILHAANSSLNKTHSIEHRNELGEGLDQWN